MWVTNLLQINRELNLRNMFAEKLAKRSFINRLSNFSSHCDLSRFTRTQRQENLNRKETDDKVQAEAPTKQLRHYSSTTSLSQELSKRVVDGGKEKKIQV